MSNGYQIVEALNYSDLSRFFS